MSQKVKYYVLLLLSVTLIVVYSHDVHRVNDKVQHVQSSIDKIDSKLQNGSEVLEQMNQIRKDFLFNKETLGTHKVSGGQLMKELGLVKGLASEMGVDIYDIEIDPRNTFPDIDQNDMNEKIQLERQSVSFNISGNFLDIGRFIDELQNKQSILQIQYCSIGLDSLDPKGVIAEMGYLTYGGAGL